MSAGPGRPGVAFIHPVLSPSHLSAVEAPGCVRLVWACVTVMGQSPSLHAAYITTSIETGSHDGLGTGFDAHGQGPCDTPSLGA
jgi:hypothetical protein